MMENKFKNSYFKFLSTITGILSEYTTNQLNEFRYISKNSFPEMTSVIEAFLQVLNSNIKKVSYNKDVGLIKKIIPTNMEKLSLENLFMSKDLFPSNKDLIEFTNRILKKKINLVRPSRATIVKKIMRALDSLNSNRREKLERMIRDEIAKGNNFKSQSFFSRWEEIIKGIEL